MTASIPLFPLSSVLFPFGRIALQVFEPRYMDMVKQCLRDGSGFGVVAIRSGSEVVTEGEAAPKLYETGTLASIADWSGLEHGRIGVIAEGSQRFRILSTRRQADYLTVAEVDYLDELEDRSLPIGYTELAALLKQLALHPSVVQLGMAFDYTSANNVACSLAQLLPISTQEKYDLLCCESNADMLARISLITNTLSGRDGE